MIAPLLILAAAPAAPPLPPIGLPENPTAQVARESEVTLKAGDVDLAGTLALPPEGAGRFPAVLLAPGGADEPFDRDANYHGIKFFHQIAQRLAAHGVASLRYDKRGVGKSKGDLRGATIASLGEDARAALAALRARPEIDPGRVAVLAHGEGATILLQAFADARAKDGKLGGVILIAASSARGDDAIIEYQTNAQRYPDPKRLADAVEKSRKVFAAVRAGSGLGKLDPATIAKAETPFFRSLIDFDPKPFVARLRSPVLLVHGQKDRQVSADHAIALKKLLAKSGNRKVTLVMDPYINHLLAQCETGYVTEYGALGSKADPETIERIADWAQRTLRPARGR